MREYEAFKGLMELSIHPPEIQPQFYQWMKLYGNYTNILWFFVVSKFICISSVAGKKFLTRTSHQPHMVLTKPGIAKEIHTRKDFPQRAS